MPASSVRELKKAITGGTLEPVYLLHGEEEFTRDATLKRLVDAALDPAARDFNLDIVRGNEVAAESLDSLLGTPPMMSSRRAVVVRGVSGLKKGARQVLDRYLASPAADVLLVLTEEGELGKTEAPLLDRSMAVRFDKVSGEALRKWVEHQAGAEGGAGITASATDLLIGAVGDDLPQLASELDKLASYSAGRPIDDTAVEELVGIRRGETLGDLLDAVAQRDANRALELLDHVLSQPRTTGVTIVLALSAQTMAIAYARALLDEGEPASRIGGALMALLKANTRTMTGRAWGDAVRCWERAAKVWSSEQLEESMWHLLNADMTLKETRASSDAQILATLILEMCASSGASVAIARR